MCHGSSAAISSRRHVGVATNAAAVAGLLAARGHVAGRVRVQPRAAIFSSFSMRIVCRSMSSLVAGLPPPSRQPRPRPRRARARVDRDLDRRPARHAPILGCGLSPGRPASSRARRAALPSSAPPPSVARPAPRLPPRALSCANLPADAPPHAVSRAQERPRPHVSVRVPRVYLSPISVLELAQRHRLAVARTVAVRRRRRRHGPAATAAATNTDSNDDRLRPPSQGALHGCGWMRGRWRRKAGGKAGARRGSIARRRRRRRRWRCERNEKRARAPKCKTKQTAVQKQALNRAFVKRWPHNHARWI